MSETFKGGPKVYMQPQSGPSSSAPRSQSASAEARRLPQRAKPAQGSAPPVYRPNFATAVNRFPAPSAPPVYRPTAPARGVPIPAFRPFAARVAQGVILNVQPAPPPGANRKQQGSYEVVSTSATRLATRRDNKSGIPGGEQIHDLAYLQANPNCLAAIGAGEKVYIVAHGDGALVGQKTPAQLADLLVRHCGLRNAAKVSVMACLAGRAQAGPGNAVPTVDHSYTSQLAQAMRVLISALPASEQGLLGKAIKGRAGFVSIGSKGTQVKGTSDAQIQKVFENYTAGSQEYRNQKATYEAFAATPEEADEWAFNDYRVFMNQAAERQRTNKEVTYYGKKDAARQHLATI